MGRPRTPQVSSRVPMIAAAVTVGVGVAYLVIIHRQDHRFSSRSIFIATYLGVIAATLVAGVRAEGTYAKAMMLSGGSNSLILIGFLGIFSIGLPLLFSGILVMPATARALSETPRPWGPAVVALSALGAVAVIIAGILLTR